MEVLVITTKGTTDMVFFRTFIDILKVTMYSIDGKNKNNSIVMFVNNENLSVINCKSKTEIMLNYPLEF